MTLRLNTPLKIYYVSNIETILCLHYNGVVCRSVLTTELYCVYTINGVGCRSVLTAEINFVNVS
jgi:hypothetical protein